MDVRNFSIARDLLYLSGALTGVAFGCILGLLRKNISRRFRNRRLTLILFVFSGVFAAFSAAILVSYGDIFSSGFLFLAAGACVPVFALAVFFPRTVTYPLILAGGLLMVWLGYSFLRFPLVAEGGSPLVYVRHEGSDRYSVKLPVKLGKTGDRDDKIDTMDVPVTPAGDRAVAVAFRIRGTQPPLDIKGFRIGFHPRYPLIGGTERGLVTRIRRGNETLYADLHLENSALKTWYSRLTSFGIVFQDIEGTIPLDAVSREMNLAIFFTDEALSLRFFRPSP
jgi:hypothetical protein